ncbi:MAG: hypothetical protein UV38_C0002G0134 [candidate division TM6 bacterium GW2011_GWE2_42_60]|nr:MAG: hypothetical protein UV38_C0002G0134 [candidate division TM6 bacterium GW2011_GWE2_42_60]HBY06109.1 hypothetical protein [Candidatus Dependentiae bacterium]
MNTNKKKTNRKLLYTLAMVFFAMPSLRAMQDFGDNTGANSVDIGTLLYVLSLLQQNNLINTPQSALTNPLQPSNLNDITQPLLAPQINLLQPSNLDNTMQPFLVSLINLWQQNNLIDTMQPAPTNLPQQNNVSFAFNGPTNIVLNQAPLPTSQPEFSRFSTTNTPQAYNTQNSQSPFSNPDYNSDFCAPQLDQQIISNQIIDIPKKRIFSQFSTTEPTGVIENPQYKIRRLNVQQNGAIGSQLFRVPSNQNTKETIDLTIPAEENNSTQQSALESTPLEKEEFDKALSNFLLHIGAAARHSILKPYFTSNRERPEYIIELLDLCAKPAMKISFLSDIEFGSEYSLFDYAVIHRSINFLEKIIKYITGRVYKSLSKVSNPALMSDCIGLIEKGAVLATQKNRTDVALFLNKKANEFKQKASGINWPVQISDAIKKWVLSKPTHPLVLRDPLSPSNTLSVSKTIEELIKPASRLGYMNAFEFAIEKGTLETLNSLLKTVTELLGDPDLTNREDYYSRVVAALNRCKFFACDPKKLEVLSDTITILQLEIACKG